MEYLDGTPRTWTIAARRHPEGDFGNGPTRAVLYELLSGRRVLERPSMLDTLNAVVRDEPPPLDSPAADIVTLAVGSSRLTNIPRRR
jgi:hypothetical protein